MFKRSVFEYSNTLQSEFIPSSDREFHMIGFQKFSCLRLAFEVPLRKLGRPSYWAARSTLAVTTQKGSPFGIMSQFYLRFLHHNISFSHLYNAAALRESSELRKQHSFQSLNYGSCIFNAYFLFSSLAVKHIVLLFW